MTAHLLALLMATAPIPEGATAALCYVDQAGVTQPVRLSKVGHTYGIGSAHGVGITGEDGVLYEIASECTPAGTEDRPQKPGPNAGAKAQAWYAFFWLDADADIHRCNVSLPAGIDVGFPPAPPPGGWHPCGTPRIGCVPHHAPAPGTFNPRIFACAGTTPGTPLPTLTRSKTPTLNRTPRTPSRTPTSGVPCDTVPGGPICTATPTARTPLATRSTTPTPAPSRSTTPSAAVTLSRSPTALSASPTPPPTCQPQVITVVRPTMVPTPNPNANWFTGCRSAK